MRMRGVLSIVAWSSVVERKGSSSLRRRARRLDLPLPVRPQMATFSPELMVRWMLRRARLEGLLVWSSALLLGSRPVR